MTEREVSNKTPATFAADGVVWDDTHAVKLGELLRKYRHRKGLTLEALAEQSGVSARTISDIERSVRRNPHRHTLDALSRELGLSHQELEQVHSLPQRSRGDLLTLRVFPLALPRVSPDFCGRDAERLRLAAALEAEGSPVVTITGPVGIGKTTLAVAAARAAEEHFERVLFLQMIGPDNTPLTPVDAARRLLRAITPAAQPMSDDDVVAQLQGALIGRRILIVCDDVANEAQVRPLLPIWSTSGILITSRVPLGGLDGVTRLPLEPLCPANSQALLEAIIPEAQRTESDTQALAEFCHHLPLALRIAGNQVAARYGATAGSALTRLASQPDRGLESFSAGDRSLLTTFELAYDRLEDEPQLVFRRLGLSDSAYSSVELVAVLTGLPKVRTRIALEQLAELSLVDFDAEGRVRLGDFVGAFARMLLAEDMEAQHARSRADAYLLAKVVAAGWWFRVYATPSIVAESRAPQVNSFDEASIWLLGELPNWFAALRRARDSSQHRAVVDAISHLHWFTRLWPYARAWDELYDLGALSAEAIGDTVQMVLNRGEITWFLLTYRRDTRRAAVALAAAEKGEEKLTAAGVDEPRLVGWNRFMRARLELGMGSYVDALRHCREAEEIFERITESEGLSFARPLQAEVLGRLGRHEEAITFLREGESQIDRLMQLDRHGRELAMANAMRIAAVSYRALGDLDACIATCTEALQQSPLLQGHPVLLAIQMERGGAYRDCGDDEAATRDFDAVDHSFSRVSEALRSN